VVVHNRIWILLGQALTSPNLSAQAKAIAVKNISKKGFGEALALNYAHFLRFLLGSLVIS
jgi:hypothetical protein